MRKWAGVLLSLLFTMLLLTSITSGIFRPFSTKNQDSERPRILLAQNTEKEEKKGEADPHFIAILKQMRDRVDAWLKSLNERIEREDVTRFEVRFLEILRGILEWFKEKLDAKIESSEEEKPKRKDKGGLFRETLERVSSFFKTG